MKVNINDFTPYREGRHKEFTSSENHCTHVGQNKDLSCVRQFKIDGKVISSTSSEWRCDYLLLNDDKQVAYYIELKGSDIDHAIDQIEHAIEMIHPSIKKYTVQRRIVYRTGSHAIHNSKVIAWKCKHKSSAKIESRQLIEKI